MERTAVALRNPNARLAGLRDPLAAVYQEVLSQAKGEKVVSTKARVSRDPRGGEEGDLRSQMKMFLVEKLLVR